MKVRSAFFKAVCAAALVSCFAVSAKAQSIEQDRARMERQTIEWFNSVNPDGAHSRLATNVGESIRSALEGGRHVHVLVPAGFSRNGQAYYAATYGGILHIFDLTPAQAAALELGDDGVVIQEGPYRKDVRGQTIAQVERLKIDNADNMTTKQEITGSVVCRMFGEMPENLALRVAYKRSGSTRTMTRPISAIPADGVLTFSIGQIDGSDDDEAHQGPLPLFVDFVIQGEQDSLFGDEPNTVVSNTAATLLDVKALSGALSLGGVAGTTWKFGGGDSTVTFLASGEVDFSDYEAGGKWRQVGDTLSFDCNDFTLFEVTISGDEMTGTWRRLKGDDTDSTAPTSLTRVASLR